MTTNRIYEIKKYTIERALDKIKQVDFSNGYNASFEIGRIFGELEVNLSKELNREKTKSSVMDKKREYDSQE